MDNSDSTDRPGGNNVEDLSNFAEDTASVNSPSHSQTQEPAGVQTWIRALLADDVLCQACRAEYRKTPVRGVRIGVRGRFPGTFESTYLAFCAYHAGELTAVMLSLRGRF